MTSDPTHEALRPWLRHHVWCNCKTDDLPNTERCKCGLSATLSTTPAPLDAAWAAAEAALPEGTPLRLRVEQLAAGFVAEVVTPRFEEGSFVRSEHDTPAAALLALAEKLREYAKP